MKNLTNLTIWMFLSTSLLFAQTSPDSKKNWEFIGEQTIQVQQQNRQILPQFYATAKVDLTALKNILADAPLRFSEEGKRKSLELSLPMPNGHFENFKVQYAPIMAPELALKYPMIRSYAGVGIENPSAYLRFDITPEGFHAIILGNQDSTILIDPYSTEDDEYYIVYYKNDLSQAEDWECFTLSEEKEKNWENLSEQQKAGDCQLRTYSLALACTGEYAAARGGTVTSVLSAMNTTMMHVNAIFEKDLSIQLVLIANNDALIFFDPATDPYTNDNITAMLSQNQTACNSIIGKDYYDIGHVFAAAGLGGLAWLSSVCNSSKKAQGASGSRSPIGFPFDAYVAHEMGHQFGATHTFNNPCSGKDGILNRHNPTAVEPGSGSTVMSYNGICFPNIGTILNSDYFHSISLEQISTFIANSGAACANTTTTNNNVPSANACPDYTIPKSTPFKLTGVGTDLDGDPLTYCWEQIDNEIAPMPPLYENTEGPMFRSYAPTLSSIRYFPNLPDILRNYSTVWEALPNVSRELNFRLTVRDNHIGGGCTAEDDMVVTVDGNSGPFLVTSPNTAVSWPALSQQTITWSVAGTNTYCPNVDILLSVDGGHSFPFVLKTATNNDGSEAVILPNHQTKFARIMVRGAGNIFFDVSNSDFIITTPPQSGSPDIQWQNTIGGSIREYLYSIQQTVDGGYILGGKSPSNISGDKTENSQGGDDYWVVKLDGMGNISWQNTIGGVGSDDLYSIEQTDDGGYILGGSSSYPIMSGDRTENTQGGIDYWVVKLDATGNISWQNTIGGSSSDYLNSVQQTFDGGYILGGTSLSNISGDKTENSKGGHDYWVVKLDAIGNISWQNTIGGSDWDLLSSIQQTDDGGYIIGGASFSNISGDKTENSQGGDDYWVVKLNAAGNISWQNTIGGNLDDYLNSIQQTNDGGYILGGTSVSNISGDKTENRQGYIDYWVVKLDGNGNITWQNTIGGSDYDDLYSIQQTDDDGFILVGTSFSNISGDKTENSQGGEDYWVVKLDASGNISWQNTIGGIGSEYLCSIKQTTDGGYILGGASESNISGDKTENSQGGHDYWIVKLSPASAGCSMDLNFTLSKPACFGTNTGSIRVNPPGPVTGYTYLWSNGATSRTINNVTAGAYTVTVTKTATGCSAVATTRLDNPPPFKVTLYPTQVGCPGTTAGRIVAKTVGGTNPKSYLWSNGATTDSITNLTAGAYSVTVTDAKGCTASGSVSLSNPTIPVIDGVTVVPDRTKWKATVQVTAPTASYKYRKCPTGGTCSGWSSNNVFSKLTAGEYTFETKNGCVTSITIQVPPTQSINQKIEATPVSEFSELRVFPNPTTGILQLRSNLSINRLIVVDFLGRVLQSEMGEDLQELDITRLPAGLYNLVVSYSESETNESVRVIKN